MRFNPVFSTSRYSGLSTGATDIVLARWSEPISSPPFSVFFKDALGERLDFEVVWVGYANRLG